MAGTISKRKSGLNLTTKQNSFVSNKSNLRRKSNAPQAKTVRTTTFAENQRGNVRHMPSFQSIPGDLDIEDTHSIADDCGDDENFDVKSVRSKAVSIKSGVTKAIQTNSTPKNGNSSLNTTKQGSKDRKSLRKNVEKVVKQQQPVTLEVNDQRNVKHKDGLPE